MATTHTVVKGDTLSELAVKYNTTVSKLVQLNNISNPDLIYIGQVLKIDGTATTPKKNTTNKATITAFGLQSNSDTTIFATWKWDKSNTENYQVRWYYDTGDGVWFVGNDSTTTYKQSTYGYPSNAKRIKFTVKPISKKRKVNNKETSYWTASWSTAKVYSVSSNPPKTPPVPTVEIDKYKLTATLNNLDVNATHIQFQIVKNDSSVFNSGQATIKTTSVSYSCTVTAGSEYKVRCRAVRGKEYSEWSDYSGNVGTGPSAPKRIEFLRALSETAVYVEWTKVTNAESYEIEYTTKKTYFDSSTEVKSATVDSKVVHAEITGLETGQEWFFRVRAINDKGKSEWTAIRSIKIGERPAAPTTWSSTTTAIVGEPLTLYWVHNSEDGSSQTYAQLELYINGGSAYAEVIQNSTDEDEKDKTSSYVIDTTDYSAGAHIEWRVKTRGITEEYSDWSIQRSIDIYAPPTLTLNILNAEESILFDVTSFPFYIHGLAGPDTQSPIGYHLSVIANESYETVDNVGNVKLISKGDAVYSKYFDTSDPLMVEFSANNVNLDNNIEYTVICTVTMNSGLTATASDTFTVSWTDIEYEPNAEISIDEDTLAASIRPYCEDENGTPIEDIVLSVYRREFDGKFTEIASGIENSGTTFVTDPHPALDYARYRIVAATKSTGAISYSDLPGYPVGGKAVVIQWDEAWSNFDTTNEDALEQPPWSGSMLKLPYNIDVSDSNKTDVALVEYIGREHPVSYYGTQLGETSTWGMTIEKDDEETLYALRRLAKWMGNVYVREPSGSGYWASISVSYAQKHRDLTIPVTLEITRVEGGI